MGAGDGLWAISLSGHLGIPGPSTLEQGRSDSRPPQWGLPSLW